MTKSDVNCVLSETRLHYLALLDDDLCLTITRGLFSGRGWVRFDRNIITSTTGLDRYRIGEKYGLQKQIDVSLELSKNYLKYKPKD